MLRGVRPIGVWSDVDHLVDLVDAREASRSARASAVAPWSRAARARWSVSLTSVDLPEPETPVTTVSSPSGTRRSTTSFRLCSRQPVISSARRPGRGARLRRDRDRAPPGQIGAGQRRLVVARHLGGRAGRRRRAPPWMPAPGPMSITKSARPDRGLVVLDHDHAVAHVAQPLRGSRAGARCPAGAGRSRARRGCRARPSGSSPPGWPAGSAAPRRRRAWRCRDRGSGSRGPRRTGSAAARGSRRRMPVGDGGARCVEARALEVQVRSLRAPACETMIVDRQPGDASRGAPRRRSRASPFAVGARSSALVYFERSSVGESTRPSRLAIAPRRARRATPSHAPLHLVDGACAGARTRQSSASSPDRRARCPLRTILAADPSHGVFGSTSKWRWQSESSRSRVVLRRSVRPAPGCDRAVGQRLETRRGPAARGRARRRRLAEPGAVSDRRRAGLLNENSAGRSRGRTRAALGAGAAARRASTPRGLLDGASGLRIFTSTVSAASAAPSRSTR